MSIAKNFMNTYAKVGTHDGDDEPIQIWAKDEKSYGGIGTDKLGIWGSVVAVDFDICVADGACIEACPVDVYDWLDTPNHPASDKKAIMVREPDCIICRACEEVCPVVAVLITDPGDIDSEAAPEPDAEEEKEDTPADTAVTDSVAATSGSQMPLTPVMQPKPHSYTGYKQNSYCVNCGKYTFHWHGASPNDPNLYPNYECKDCGYVRKIKIS
jgi:NAD-dependent dihydropyrimidine dehydrogenase PreA subunit